MEKRDVVLKLTSQEFADIICAVGCHTQEMRDGEALTRMCELHYRLCRVAEGEAVED